MKEEKFNLVVGTSHWNGTAEIGEKVFFNALMRGAESTSKVFDGAIRWKLTWNGAVVSSGEFPAVSHAAGVPFVPERPGYCRCDFEGVVGGVVVCRGSIGVLADPKNIASSFEIPPDFDAFWARQRERLRAVPPNLRVRRLDTVCGLETSDVAADCPGGAPVRGILMHPENAAPRSLPAALLLQGAGVRSAGGDYQPGLAQRGFLTLDVNAHGIENGLPPEEYLEIGKTDLAAYPGRGFDSGDPEKVYFLGMFLRVLRAIDVLAASPLWDGRNLVLWGPSQGAWQSLAGAAFSDRVTCLCVYIPAGCGILPCGGWPFVRLAEAAGGGDLKMREIAKTAPYFDGIALCSRIGSDIPVMFGIGLADDVCRADGVVAAYNRLKSPRKRLSAHCDLGHDANHSGYIAEQAGFMLEHLL